MVVHQSLSVTPTLSADGTVLVPLDQQQTQRHLAFHHHRHFGPTSPSSAMAPSSSSAAAMTPLGVILVSKDESAERVLFMYPFERRVSPHSAHINSREKCHEHKDSVVPMIGKEVPKLGGGGTPDDVRCQPAAIDTGDQQQQQHLGDGIALDGTSIGFPVKIGNIFSLKLYCFSVDNLRFVGFPWHITGCVHSLAVVFILRGSADRHIVDAFQRLSKKIAIAINTEQQRCNYLRDQISLMQPSHDEYEALPDELKKGRCPYEAILEKSGLAKHLRDIFEDVCDYGMVDVFVDDCIEVGFCVEPKALCHVGLASRSAAEIEATMRHIRPYHGLLFLDESIPNPDSNPFVRRFIDEYEPSRSFEELAHLSGLPIDQVLQIVRHYLLWARAMLIYPICTTNVYANAPQQPHNFRTLEAQFGDRFGSDCCPMADVLEAFSPPCSLGSFLQDMTIYTGRPSLHMSLMVFLLRNQLLVQLHTFFFLLPLPSTDANDSCKANQQHNHNQSERGRRDSEASNDDAKEVEEGGEEDGTETAAEQPQQQWVGPPPPPAAELGLSPETCSLVHDSREFIPVALKSHILTICARAVHLVGVPESEVFDILAAFMTIVPFMDGRHHLEDIMYRTQLERSTVMRILDTFSDIVCPFYCHDVVLDDE
ncbi:hypothetical protein niasHS_014126 [Heterodera schachtii]|uniref:GATOR complex protein NPRL3 n=1 Tax=Heterodera schachtii TaxID=97005 RepID=A0ABD2II69_HETSC